jgi:hypothetical protein
MGFVSIGFVYGRRAIDAVPGDAERLSCHASAV